MKNINSYLFLLIVLVGFSCKTMEIPPMPEVPKIPAEFLGATPQDSLSIADIPWDRFFDDPYLTALIEEGLGQNFDVLTAFERIEQARVQYRIRKNALMPTLDGIVRYRSGDIRPNLLNGTINGDRNVVNRLENNFVGFQSHWEIDIWGKLRDRRAAAFNRFMASEMGYHLVVTNLVAEIAHLYYDLLGFDMELETIEKNIAFQRQALELIKIQKIAGRATELAVQQFSAQLLNTQSLRFEKLQEINETEYAISYLLGKYPGSVERAESLLDIEFPNFLEVGLPMHLLLRRPDLQQAELEMYAARLDVEAARKEFLPSLNLTPYVGLNDRSLPAAFQFPGAVTVGLLGGLTSPIFQQHRIRGAFEQDIAQNRIQVYNYSQSIIHGYTEVVTGFKRVENLKNKYLYKQEETKVLQSAVSTANGLFRGGYASYLEVITAQARVLEAELEMTTTRKEIFHSVVDLYRSLGGGW
ncbi:TolC family protein [Litoribacter populi]|uniref:TolC family protein n=1 Tax=Litoribacter populi TaxID=2598460 RepID=UPI00117BEB12|nr:TolC family protein [Litoribacter populi]